MSGESVLLGLSPVQASTPRSGNTQELLINGVVSLVDQLNSLLNENAQQEAVVARVIHQRHDEKSEVPLTVLKGPYLIGVAEGMLDSCSTMASEFKLQSDDLIELAELSRCIDPSLASAVLSLISEQMLKASPERTELVVALRLCIELAHPRLAALLARSWDQQAHPSFASPSVHSTVPLTPASTVSQAHFAVSPLTVLSPNFVSPLATDVIKSRNSHKLVTLSPFPNKQLFLADMPRSSPRGVAPTATHRLVATRTRVDSRHTLSEHNADDSQSTGGASTPATPRRSSPTLTPRVLKLEAGTLHVRAKPTPITTVTPTPVNLSPTSPPGPDGNATGSSLHHQVHGLPPAQLVGGSNHRFPPFLQDDDALQIQHYRSQLLAIARLLLSQLSAVVQNPSFADVPLRLLDALAVVIDRMIDFLVDDLPHVELVQQLPEHLLNVLDKLAKSKSTAVSFRAAYTKQGLHRLLSEDRSSVLMARRINALLQTGAYAEVYSGSYPGMLSINLMAQRDIARMRKAFQVFKDALHTTDSNRDRNIAAWWTFVNTFWRLVFDTIRDPARFADIERSIWELQFDASISWEGLYGMVEALTFLAFRTEDCNIHKCVPELLKSCFIDKEKWGKHKEARERILTNLLTLSRCSLHAACKNAALEALDSLKEHFNYSASKERRSKPVWSGGKKILDDFFHTVMDLTPQGAVFAMPVVGSRLFSSAAPSLHRMYAHSALLEQEQLQLQQLQSLREATRLADAAGEASSGASSPVIGLADHNVSWTVTVFADYLKTFYKEQFESCRCWPNVKIPIGEALLPSLHDSLPSSELMSASRQPVQYPQLFQTGAAHRVLIEGAAGSGKSLLVRRALRDWAKGTVWNQFHLVIFIQCSELQRYSELFGMPSREDIIRGALAVPDHVMLPPVLNDSIEMSHCRILYVLDGYDESVHLQYDPTHRVVSCVLQQLLRTHGRHSLLLTSRPRVNAEAAFDGQVQRLRISCANCQSDLMRSAQVYFKHLHHGAADAASRRTPLLRTKTLGVDPNGTTHSFPTLRAYSHFESARELTVVRSDIEDRINQAYQRFEKLLQSDSRILMLCRRFTTFHALCYVVASNAFDAISHQTLSHTSILAMALDLFIHQHCVARLQAHSAHNDSSAVIDDADQLKRALGAIGFRCMLQHSTSIMYSDVKKTFLNAGLRLNPGQLIESGLVVGVHSNAGDPVAQLFRFDNRRLQEFLTAYHVAIAAEDVSKRFVLENRYSFQFDQVLPHLAGLTSGCLALLFDKSSPLQPSPRPLPVQRWYSQFFKWFDRSPKDFVGLCHLELIAQCAEECVGSTAFSALEQHLSYQDAVREWLLQLSSMPTSLRDSAVSHLLQSLSSLSYFGRVVWTDALADQRYPMRLLVLNQLNQREYMLENHVRELLRYGLKSNDSLFVSWCADQLSECCELSDMLLEYWLSSLLADASRDVLDSMPTLFATLDACLSNTVASFTPASHPLVHGFPPGLMWLVAFAQQYDKARVTLLGLLDAQIHDNHIVVLTCCAAAFLIRAFPSQFITPLVMLVEYCSVLAIRQAAAWALAHRRSVCTEIVAPLLAALAVTPDASQNQSQATGISNSLYVLLEDLLDAPLHGWVLDVLEKLVDNSPNAGFELAELVSAQWAAPPSDTLSYRELSVGDRQFEESKLSTSRASVLAYTTELSSTWAVIQLSKLLLKKIGPIVEDSSHCRNAQPAFVFQTLGSTLSSQFRPTEVRILCARALGGFQTGDAASEDDCAHWLVKRLLQVLDETFDCPQLRAVCIDALASLALVSDDVVPNQLLLTILTTETKKLAKDPTESIAPIMSCIAAITQLQFESGYTMLAELLQEDFSRSKVVLVQTLLHALTPTRSFSSIATQSILDQVVTLTHLRENPPDVLLTLLAHAVPTRLELLALSERTEALALDIVMRAAESSSPVSRQRAAEVLGLWQTDRSDVMAALQTMLTEPLDDLVPKSAAWAIFRILRQQPAQFEKFFIRGLQFDQSEDCRCALANSLLDLPVEDALKCTRLVALMLNQALLDPSFRVRTYLTCACQTLLSNSKEMLSQHGPTLIQRCSVSSVDMNGERVDLRALCLVSEVLAALPSIAGSAGPLLDCLCAALRQSDPLVVSTALACIDKCATVETATAFRAPLMTIVINSVSQSVDQSLTALSVLRHLCTLYPPMFDSFVWKSAIGHLFLSGSSPSTAHDDSLGDSLLMFISQFGSEIPDVLNACCDALRNHPSTSTRLLAAEILGRIGTNDAVAPEFLLEACQRDSNASVRHQCAVALSWTVAQSTHIFEGLLAALVDRSDEVCSAAASALVRLARRNPDALIRIMTGSRFKFRWPRASKAWTRSLSVELLVALAFRSDRIDSEALMLLLEKSTQAATPVWFEASRFYFIDSCSTNRCLDFNESLRESLRDAMLDCRLRLIGLARERVVTVDTKSTSLGRRTLSDDRRAFDRFLLPPTASRSVLSPATYAALQRQLEQFVSMLDERSLPAVKVVLVGDSRVGKTAFTTRLVFGQYSSIYQPSESVDVRQTLFDLFGKRFRMQLIDTPGNEDVAYIRSKFYGDVACALVMFDLSDLTTFNRVPLFVMELRARRPTISITLVGSKLDLSSERQVDHERAQQLATQLDLDDFVEVSAVFGDRVLSCMQATVITTLFQHAFGSSIRPLRSDKQIRDEGSS